MPNSQVIEYSRAPSEPAHAGIFLFVSRARRLVRRGGEFPRLLGDLASFAGCALPESPSKIFTHFRISPWRAFRALLHRSWAM